MMNQFVFTYVYDDHFSPFAVQKDKSGERKDDVKGVFLDA